VDDGKSQGRFSLLNTSDEQSNRLYSLFILRLISNKARLDLTKFNVSFFFIYIFIKIFMEIVDLHHAYAFLISHIVCLLRHIAYIIARPRHPTQSLILHGI